MCHVGTEEKDKGLAVLPSADSLNVWKADSTDFHWKQPVGVFSTLADRRCDLMLTNQMSLFPHQVRLMSVSFGKSLLEKQKQINTPQHKQELKKMSLRPGMGKAKYNCWSKEFSELISCWITSPGKAFSLSRERCFVTEGRTGVLCYVELSVELRTMRNLWSLCSQTLFGLDSCIPVLQEVWLMVQRAPSMPSPTCDALVLCQWGLCRTTADRRTPLALKRCCNLNKDTKG